MSTEPEGIQRHLSASVRGMFDAYRIQAQAGPVTDKALEDIIFPGGARCHAEPQHVYARSAGRAAAESRAHAAGGVSGGRDSAGEFR